MKVPPDTSPEELPVSFFLCGHGDDVKQRVCISPTQEQTSACLETFK